MIAEGDGQGRHTLANFAWTDSTHARADAIVQPGQVVAIQVTYDPRWTATANGRSISVERDGIGLMTLRPQCDGPCQIQLTFKPSQQIYWMLSGLVTLVAVGSCFRKITAF